MERRHRDSDIWTDHRRTANQTWTRLLDEQGVPSSTQQQTAAKETKIQQQQQHRQQAAAATTQRARDPTDREMDREEVIT